jgi:hypothetical protein
MKSCALKWRWYSEFLQRLGQAERGALVEPGPLGDLGQGQAFLAVGENVQDGERTLYRCHTFCAHVLAPN